MLWASYKMNHSVDFDYLQFAIARWEDFIDSFEKAKKNNEFLLE